MITTTDGVWNEPGGIYFKQAMEELGFEANELEEAEEENNIPVGKYPALDQVYELAWKLRTEEERVDA